MGELTVSKQQVEEDVAQNDANTDASPIIGQNRAFESFADFAASNGYVSSIDMSAARSYAEQMPDIDIYRMVADNIAVSVQGDADAISMNNIGLNNDTRIAVASVIEELDENTGNIYHAVYNNADGTYYTFAQQITIDELSGQANSEMIYAGGWDMRDMEAVKLRSNITQNYVDSVRALQAEDGVTVVEEFAEEKGLPISSAGASSYITEYEGRAASEDMVIPINGSSVVVIERSYNLDSGESTLSAEFTNLAEGNIVTSNAQVSLEIDKDIIRDNLDVLEDRAAEENGTVQNYNPLNP